MDVPSIWKKLLQMIELAKHHDRPYLLSGIGSLARNPILEELLPSLLFLQSVSIFEVAIREEMETRGLKLPKKAGKDLAQSAFDCRDS